MIKQKKELSRKHENWAAQVLQMVFPDAKIQVNHHRGVDIVAYLPDGRSLRFECKAEGSMHKLNQIRRKYPDINGAFIGSKIALFLKELREPLIMDVDVFVKQGHRLLSPHSSPLSKHQHSPLSKALTAILLTILFLTSGWNLYIVSCQPSQPNLTNITASYFNGSFQEWQNQAKTALYHLKQFLLWLNGFYIIILYKAFQALNINISIETLYLVAAFLTAFSIYQLIIRNLKMEWGNLVAIFILILLLWAVMK